MLWFKSSCQAVEPHEHKLKGRSLRPFEVVSTSLVAPLALGVFILTGCVAQGVAGPAVLLAVVLAALIATVSGFCYTEFAAHFPSTRGPATYLFTVSGAGRLAAFLVTWHTALDFVIGAAIAARGARAALDSLLNNTLARSFQNIAPLENDLTSPYVDFLALILPLIAAGILVIAGREFAAPKVSAFLVALLAVLFIIVAGSLEADNANWSIKPGENGQGDGGFMPFGLIGIVQGAAILTFTFLGLDLIAAPGRRVQGDEPAAWGTSVVSVVTCVCLVSVGVVITFMQPFHLLDGNSAVVSAFSNLSWPEAEWIVGIAGFFTLLITVVACTARAARLVGALEDDRMLWPLQRSRGSLASFPATLAIAVVAGLTGAFFQERHLVYVLWTGSVLSLAVVPASLLMYRCRCEETSDEMPNLGDVLRHFFLPPCASKLRKPSTASSAAATTATYLFCLCCCGACAVALHTRVDTLWALILLVVFVVLAIIALTSLSSQPTTYPPGFALPLAPLVAGVAILGACCMLVSPSDSAPWIRLGSWTILGMLVFAISWRGENAIKGDLTAVMQENGKSSPPPLHDLKARGHESLENDSGFSLDVELCSSSGGSRHEPSSGRHTALNMTDEMLEPSVIGTLVQKESIIVRDNVGKEENLIQTEAEMTCVEVKQVEPHEFDESKWNALWETASHHSATDSEKSSIETVAQVHESSTEDLVLVIDDTRPQENGDFEKQEHLLTNAEMESAGIVVELPGGASVGEETSSDEDISEPPLPPPLPQHSPLNPSTPKEVRKNPPTPLLLNPDENISVAQSRPQSPVPPPPPLPANSPLFHTTPDEVSKNPSVPISPESENISLQKEGIRTPTQSTAVVGFQEELRNTLKLLSQKQIDDIENTVVNVSEGIEIFGGRRSRTTSINKTEPEINSIKSAMKAGKFEDPAFVNKLNTILKGQMGKIPAENQRAPRYPRSKKVVFVAPDDPPVNQENELAERMKLMRNTLSQLLDVRRESILQPPSKHSTYMPISNNKQKTRAPAPPPPAVHKSLDFLGTDLQIISKD